VCRTF
ncbi:peptidase M3 family protein, partial [Escherichia coli 95.0183]